MNDSELWQYFIQKKVAQAKPFDRLFIWITDKDFENVKKYFVQERNIIHSGKSYRTKSLLKHIHAVEQDGIVFVHFDIGNVARFFPLGLIHLIFDVIPYLWFSISRKIPMYKLFEKP